MTTRMAVWRANDPVSKAIDSYIDGLIEFSKDRAESLRDVSHDERVAQLSLQQIAMHDMHDLAVSMRILAKVAVDTAKDKS